jgi:hypothetical protein
MKNYFYALLIVIIIVLSYFKFYSANSTPITTTSPAPSASLAPSASPIAVSPLNTDFFTLTYPVEATTPAVIKSPDSIEWRIMYMGDTQKASGRTQTELFDGYMVSLTRFEVPTSTNSARLQAEADRQSTIDACGEGGATPISEGKVGSYPALTFFGGCLGEATQYYLTNNGELYRITAMVVGPETTLKSYNQLVQNIFTSLKFLTK